MSAPEVYEESIRVRSYEVEPDGRLRLVVLARLLQEAAWQHARRLGWGLIHREAGSLFWVLSRLRIVMKRYPHWGDEFTIRTWPVGTRRILAVREYLLSDGEGELGRVSTGWLVVDGTTGRPVRPQKLVANARNVPPEFPGDLERIPELTGGEAGERREALYHDIDRYRHVNNSAYLEWMIDAIATQGEGEPHIASAAKLEMDFLQELLIGEEFMPRIHVASGLTECEILRAADAQPICRARFHWKEGENAVHDDPEHS